MVLVLLLGLLVLVWLVLLFVLVFGCGWVWFGGWVCGWCGVVGGVWGCLWCGFCGCGGFWGWVRVGLGVLWVLVQLGGGFLLGGLVLLVFLGVV